MAANPIQGWPMMMMIPTTTKLKVKHQHDNKLKIWMYTELPEPHIYHICLCVLPISQFN